MDSLNQTVRLKVEFDVEINDVIVHMGKVVLKDWLVIKREFKPSEKSDECVKCGLPYPSGKHVAQCQPPAKKCGCGLTWGTIHRFDGPCEVIEKPPPPPADPCNCGDSSIPGIHSYDGKVCHHKPAEQGCGCQNPYCPSEHKDGRIPKIYQEPPLPREVEEKIKKIASILRFANNYIDEPLVLQMLRELCEMMRARDA